jgi:hypothetical protein
MPRPYAYVCRKCDHRAALHLSRPRSERSDSKYGPLYTCPCGCQIEGLDTEMYGVNKAQFETGRYEPTTRPLPPESGDQS